MEKGKELIEKLEKKFVKIEKEKMPKDVKKNIIKKILATLLKGSILVLTLVIINIAYSTMIIGRIENDIKIFSGVFLVIGIINLEIAYKKDCGTKTISALEFIVLSVYLLSTTYLIQRLKINTNILYITSSTIVGIYYIIKSICIYIKLKKEYLKTLSDISDIVKKEEPTIKEAKKRKENTDTKTTVVKKEKGKKKTNSNLTKKSIKKSTEKSTKKPTSNKEIKEKDKVEEKQTKKSRNPTTKKSTTKKVEKSKKVSE